MAANLATTKNGTAMMASLRQNPWHNQGVVFHEEVSGQEMLKLAGLDLTVKAAPVTFNGTKESLNEAPIGWNEATDAPIMGFKEEPVMGTIPDLKVVYRSDTGGALGVVGNDYQIYQNKEIVSFFEGLVQGRKIVYETCGGLGNGNRVWLLARIPELKLDIKGDEMNTYMLIRSGHAGNMALACFPTTVRVICQNSMRGANRQFFDNRAKYGANTVNAGYSIKHTKNMLQAVESVQKAYQACFDDLKLNKEMYDFLAGINFTSSQKDEFFKFLVDPTKDEKDRAKELSKRKEARQAVRMETFNKLLESPTNQTGTKGTFFTLMNVLTEYVDHERGTRVTDDSQDDASSRFESAMFGSGDALKAQGLDKLLAMAGA